jgi:hypothetical protein
LRTAVVCSKIVNERQRHGSRRIRLDLMNGMHITVLNTVADDSRTRLSGALAPQRLHTAAGSHQCFFGHLGAAVHLVLRKTVFPPTPGAAGGRDAPRVPSGGRRSSEDA